ncbi:MAG: fatty acid oxidation complex subunit alpha FadB [Zetaproteobacteria bacterium]|nr:fatty acid oxidation complex subunit alpha FadB [Pseudobdellovibrionaceae bacterium]
MVKEKSLFAGEWIECFLLDSGVAEVIFNAKNASVNKFNSATLRELRGVVDAIKQQPNLKGVLFSSAKDVFIVGADITEFTSLFKYSEEDLNQWLMQTHILFNEIEDFEVPTIVAINGVCLGGGFELALSTVYRIASEEARVGLPETKLGIIPGWGGTVRLPRLIGADHAIEWIAGGAQHKPHAAKAVGCIDSVVNSSDLRSAALEFLSHAISGKLDWRARREEKKKPLSLLSPIENIMAFETAQAFIAQKAGSNYPAPLEALKAMKASASLTRDEAASFEIKSFIKVAKSHVAESLVNIFLSDQYNKKKMKSFVKSSDNPLRASAVLGAGIMGGGIAYQSSSKGIPILMKDIEPQALQQGMKEAGSLFLKGAKKGKITEAQMIQSLASITPVLSYGEFERCDVVIEAVVENENIKKKVLAEVEALTKEGVTLASNTSTISITNLAQGLKRPENFCGMHFFNPVHKMPLVEVIRGKETSEQTIGSVVKYALKMGKTPIVVNDCPGFLVNRVLFPYFYGLMGLLEDGVDFRKIDRVMEKFGWPMGPAYLLDVIGIDTACHAASVMGQAFPDRMQFSKGSLMDILFKEGRLGQKNGLGFYEYRKNRKGRLEKIYNPGVEQLVQAAVTKNPKDVSDQQIVERMMLPMIIESSLCLEEKIVETAMEVDLGVIYGLGFPPFRGGVLKYADHFGVDILCEKSKQYIEIGACYKPSEFMLSLAKTKQKFYKA